MWELHLQDLLRAVLPLAALVPAGLRGEGERPELLPGSVLGRQGVFQVRSLPCHGLRGCGAAGRVCMPVMSRMQTHRLLLVPPVLVYPLCPIDPFSLSSFVLFVFTSLSASSLSLLCLSLLFLCPCSLCPPISGPLSLQCQLTEARMTGWMLDSSP